MLSFPIGQPPPGSEVFKNLRTTVNLITSIIEQTMITKGDKDADDLSSGGRVE